jgi:hypothetical protein
VHRANRLLSESTLMLRTLREQADGRTNARLLHPDAKYSRASRIFYGRFLRPEDFLLQDCATQRNAARMLNCRITQHPQRCATLRKRAQKLCLELEIRCRLYIYSRKRRRAKKIRVRKAISKAISGVENGICYASALCFAVRLVAIGSENVTVGFELPIPCGGLCSS